MPPGIWLVILLLLLWPGMSSAAAPSSSAASGSASSGGAAIPRRVMSIYLCSDQLLLALLPPSRITSVSYLSRERGESYLTEQAQRVGTNYGTAEEVVAQKPDLVIAGQYTTPATRQLLKQVGIPMLELPAANNFRQIREITRQVAHAVGADQQGERLLRQMDATLAELAQSRPKRPISILGWEGRDYVPGQDTLFNAIVTAAGAVNLGAAPGLRGRNFDVERLLMIHPDLLAFGDTMVSTPGLHARPLLHPAVRRLYAGREIVYPALLYSCGLPQSAQAAWQLRQIMLQSLHARP